MFSLSFEKKAQTDIAARGEEERSEEKLKKSPNPIRLPMIRREANKKGKNFFSIDCIVDVFRFGKKMSYHE